MSIRKQILDPLSTLCKLAAISFYDDGSKLHLYDNIIEIEQPYNSELNRWIVRRYRGDTIEHISLLYNPIIKAIQWYIFNKNKKSSHQNDDGDSDTSKDSNQTFSTANQNTPTLSVKDGEIVDPTEKLQAVKNIMKYAIDGLRKLKKTYREGNVILTLQLLINNLKMAIKDDLNETFFMEYNEIDLEEDGILNYDKIKGIWDMDTIKNVSNQINMCDKNKSDSTTLEFMLASLNLSLKNTDTKFKKLVTDMNSTL